MKSLSLPLIAAALAAVTAVADAQIADKVVREKIDGIDVLAYRTDVKDVVTFRGSLPAGDSFAPGNNTAIPTLAGEMLDKGTVKHDKFAIAQQLEAIGATIDFSVGGVMTEFRGKCLRKDFPLVISLLAEQLRTPAFPEEAATTFVRRSIACGLMTLPTVPAPMFKPAWRATELATI